MERDGDRVPLGRLDRGDVARWDLDVVDVPEPVVLAEGVLLSGEMRTPEPYEAIPPWLRMEEAGALVPDTFIGEQTLLAHVRDRGLVVITSCSHRGIVGVCRTRCA
jgi:7,8-dihydropterin-6-yl-methyl-4-(beta-D-ribofuranosyl)aminobenzene 5'-phosphate synthase